MVNLTEIMLIGLLLEIIINITALAYIPYRTKRNVLKYIRQIDEKTMKAIVAEIFSKLDTKEIENQVTTAVSSSIKHMVAGKESGRVRANKGFDKVVVQDLLKHTPIGQGISVLPGAKEYLLEHPQAVESLLCTWIPAIQRIRSSGNFASLLPNEQNP